MRKMITAESSAFLLFALFFIGGLASIARLFLVETAPLSFSNPLWILVTIGYFTTQVALLVHQIYYHRTSGKTLQLPTWWNNAPLMKGTVVFAVVSAIGLLFSTAPFDRLVIFTLNSFWLNFPLTLLAVVAIKAILKNGFVGTIRFFDVLTAAFLYIGLFFAAPLFIYYPLVNRTIIIFSGSLATLAYLELPLPSSFFDRLTSKRTVLIALASLLAFSTAVFIYFSVTGLFTTPSIMDEGSYSIKGYLFATGEYFPFQDYGPWTNKMPLAFMIPGWVQLLFGPSLYAIRAAALVMQVISLICLFILGYRFYGFAGGTLAVAAFALNPALPNFYSQGNTQVVSLFLTALVLVFTLGKDRSVFSLFVGNIIAGILLLARENMAPFVVFMNIYLLWEHGWRRSTLPIFSGWLVFGIGHVVYWPGILKVWANWMPKELTPFLDEFRNKGGGKLMWEREGRDTDFITSLGSFTQGISSNLVNMIAVFGLPLLFKKLQRLTTEPFFKVNVFLWVSVIFLNAIHAGITLNDGSCVYCFSSYLSFFSPLAIVLFVVSLRFISEHSSTSVKAIFVTLVGAFFAADWYNRRQDLRWLTQLRLTSIINESGFQFLSDLLESNFKVDYEISKSLVPVLFGVGAFVLIVSISYWVWKKWLSDRFPASGLTGSLAILGLMLPTAANLVFYATDPIECRSNIPAAYAKATRQVSDIIPKGKQVFWLGESTAILLGLQNEFYPQQFNEGFSFKVGSDDELAERYGFWNPNLAREWSEETDFMLIEENKMENPILDNVNFSNFTEVGKTTLVNGCDKNSYYRVYERNR